MSETPKQDFSFYEKLQHVFNEKEIAEIMKHKSGFEAAMSEVSKRPQEPAKEKSSPPPSFSVDGFQFPDDTNLSLVMMFYALIQLNNPVIDDVFKKFNLRLVDMQGKIIFPRPQGRGSLWERVRNKLLRRNSSRGT